MDKNTIIAIVLILFIIMAFQFLYLRPKLEEMGQQQTEKPATQEQTAEETEREKIPEDTSEEKEEDKATAGFTVPAQDAQKKTISIDTRNYRVKISTEGAAITSLKLKEYMDKDGQPVELVPLEDNNIRPFEIHFNRLKHLQESSRAVYYMKKQSENSYTFYRNFRDKNGNVFRLSKTYVFKEHEHMFDLKIELEAVDDEVYLNQENISYTLVWGPLLGPKSVIKNRYNITTQGYYEDGKFHSVFGGLGGCACSLRSDESKYTEISKFVDWVGVHNRYFFIGMIPEHKNYLVAFDQREQGKYFFGISHQYFRGDDFQDTFRIYAGPKDRQLLKSHGRDFESVMGGRILKPIVVFLEFMVKKFYSFTHNYGLAIILMTIVIKIILHPLTYKSFKSMRRMSALQPKINEIREKYKNSPQQMNREITALYRREKINPMGGCLPMLLQLPIFIALYNMLTSMIELRNEAFLWIQDLSMPDAVATIKTAIPLLGYTVAGQGYTDINILPFIMTGTTLLQSKLTSGGQASQQGKMMTYMFPLIFFFIFWNMPSGLVLYWTIQNILTVGQQYLIDYRMKKQKQEAENKPVAKSPPKKKTTWVKSPPKKR